MAADLGIAGETLRTWVRKGTGAHAPAAVTAPGPHHRMSHDEALALVQRLLDSDIASEAEGDEILNALHRGLACPHISDCIYWEADPDHSAERIVDRALAYKPIAL
nr:hypothetical protein OG781_26815 [Streptomyces sp. NBC_00830]